MIFFIIIFFYGETFFLNINSLIQIKCKILEIFFFFVYVNLIKSEKYTEYIEGTLFTNKVI